MTYRLRAGDQAERTRRGGSVGLRCQAGYGIAHEHGPGAVRDPGRMAITGDSQILARKIVRVEPGIDDDQASIA